MKKHFIFLFGGVVFFFIFFSANVHAATFSVSPASGTFNVGDTITTTIFLDTAGIGIDGADVAYLEYNPSLLQVVDEDTGIAGVQILPGFLMEVNPTNGNVVDTGLGRIRFSQVTSGGTTFTSAGAQTFATVRFTALAGGTATLAFTNFGGTADSNVAASGGMDFLTSANGASYSLMQLDTDPPIISNVQVTNITTNSALVTWTTNEPADSRVDYGLTSTLGASVSSPTLVTSHSLTLTGLSSNALYYYQVRSKDAAQNESVSTMGQFSTVPVVAQDTTSPAQIVDLRATAVRKLSADLAWTATGDDGNVGTAASYDIRYSKTPLSESTWGSATQATGEPIPAVSGSLQTYKLISLKRDTTYWVGIKARDEVPSNLPSPLSNVITFKTNRSGTAQSDASSLFAAPLLAQGTEGMEDTTPPKDVMQFQAKGVNAQIILFWKNPHDPDYVRTLIVKKAGTVAPTSPQDGTKIYEGTNEMFTDINLTNGMSYSYTAFTFDETPNYSRGVSVTASPNQNVTSASSSITHPSVLSRGLFTRLLARGIKDSDVRQLQQFLISQGYLASGNDTGYFGALTEQALKDFQCKKNIVCDGTSKTTGWGVFGPKTRALANQLFGTDVTPNSLTSEQRQQLINSLQQQLNTLMQQLQKLLMDQGR